MAIKITHATMKAKHIMIVKEAQKMKTNLLDNFNFQMTKETLEKKNILEGYNGLNEVLYTSYSDFKDAVLKYFKT
mgnify:FL=1